MASNGDRHADAVARPDSTRGSIWRYAPTIAYLLVVGAVVATAVIFSVAVVL